MKKKITDRIWKKQKGAGQLPYHYLQDMDIPDVDMIDLDASPQEAEALTEEDEALEIPEEKPGFLDNSTWRFRLHMALAAVCLLFILFAVYRFFSFGRVVNPDEVPANNGPEVMDYFAPVFHQEQLNMADDGELQIVAFGNAPFADDRESADGLANLIAAKSKATVYNVSVADSLLSAQSEILDLEKHPMDAFSFYWLTTVFCLRNNAHVYQHLLDSQSDTLPQDARQAYNTLSTLDFSKVDVITLMYDGSDYLAGRPMYSDQNRTDITQFTGNMEAGLELILSTYPHIRIIVLSPTYAYGLDSQGKFVSSDIQRYGQDVLSTYVIKQMESAYTQGVTFVDNLYGTVNEDDAPKYLRDHIHLNVAGRKRVAERFDYALNYFQIKAQEQQKN